MALEREGAILPFSSGDTEAKREAARLLSLKTDPTEVPTSALPPTAHSFRSAFWRKTLILGKPSVLFLHCCDLST